MNISPFSPAAGLSRNTTGASNTSSANPLLDTSASDSIEQQFLNYAKMSPIERMRASILKDMNLSESDVASMSPQEQQKVEEIIKEKIKEQLDKMQNGKPDSAPGSAPAVTADANAPSSTPSLNSSVLAQMISVQANQQAGMNAASARHRDEF